MNDRNPLQEMLFMKKQYTIFVRMFSGIKSKLRDKNMQSIAKKCYFQIKKKVKPGFHTNNEDH